MKWVFMALSRLHLWLYRLSGGKLLHTMMGQPVVILTTKGRRSGRSWTVPLLSFKDNDDYILVASNGGRNYHPAWYLNLQATQEGVIEVTGKQQTAYAEDTTGAERERLWAMIVSKAPVYRKYAQKTKRVIPIVRLKVSQFRGDMNSIHKPTESNNDEISTISGSSIEPPNWPNR